MPGQAGLRRQTGEHLLVKNGLLEEIKWYRDQIRTSKEAGCKKYKSLREKVQVSRTET